MNEQAHREWPLPAEHPGSGEILQGLLDQLRALRAAGGGGGAVSEPPDAMDRVLQAAPRQTAVPPLGGDAALERFRQELANGQLQAETVTQVLDFFERVLRTVLDRRGEAVGGMLNGPYIASALAVVAPMVGVPLTVILFYLRSLREQGVVRQTDMAARISLVEQGLRQAREHLAVLQREQTTREEWLRETMWTRHRVEQLGTRMTRLETAGLQASAPGSSPSPPGAGLPSPGDGHVHSLPIPPCGEQS